MKTVCLILSILLDGSQEVREKPMDSLTECRAWARQQEFMYSVHPIQTSVYVCLNYWEA